MNCRSSSSDNRDLSRMKWFTYLHDAKASGDHQKSYANNRHKPLEFEVGDRVMLKVSPWKGVVHFGKKGKLAPRISLEGDEILRVQGERTQGVVKTLLNTKSGYSRGLQVISRCSSRNFSKIAKPLTSLTQKNQKYVWGVEQEEAFQTLKNNLCDAPILSLPDGVEDFVVYCDASNQGLGCVLMQEIRNDTGAQVEAFNQRRTVLAGKVTCLDHQMEWEREWKLITQDSLDRVSIQFRLGGYVKGYHTSIRCAPFEALYGRKCRSPVLWAKIGEGWKIRVMLKVSPWKGVVHFGKKGKLAPRYVGPFEILERIGPVAYRLRLSKDMSGVHDTFHV
ncbi:putative reverse transcriptase domain-containing protein [Tanacetum coccineum]